MPNDRLGPPVAIHLELRGLQLHIMDMMAYQQEKLQGMIKEAIEREVTSDAIQRIIETSARELLERSVREEMESYFRHGEGHKAISKRVASIIAKELNDEGT